MADFLDALARDAAATVRSGYYNVKGSGRSRCSLKQRIEESDRTPIIAEIKLASPSRGDIAAGIDVKEVARSYCHNGAVGVSVVTEPRHFKGDLTHLSKVREAVKLPVLMKDIVVSAEQIRAAHRLGADAVLLIKTLYDRGYGELTLDGMIRQAHLRDIEVIVETHAPREFAEALETEADMIGVNNRDLATLKVDINTTKRVLGSVDPRGRIVVSESGITTVEQIRSLKAAGAKAFLIGSSLVSDPDPGKALRRLLQS